MGYRNDFLIVLRCRCRPNQYARRIGQDGRTIGRAQGASQRWQFTQPSLVQCSVPLQCQVTSAGRNRLKFNFFLQSGVLGFAISAIGLLIFAGLTAWDTQRLKEDYDYLSQDGALLQKSSVMGALSLYLNFINMFQFILTLTGSREE